MKMNKRWYLVLVAIIHPNLQAYSVQDYLQETAEKDPSLKAVTMEYQASEYSLRLPEQVTAIKIFSNAGFQDDGRPVLLPAFQGSRTTSANLALGLTQQSPFGLNWTLSQNLTHTKIFGMNGSALTDYYDFFPSAEVTVPLWRNFLGSETRAQRDVIKTQTQLQNVQANIEKATKLVDIERAYYQYGIQQNLLDLAKKNLDHGEKIYKWVSARRKQNLIDDSDELQARAALSLRRLELDRADRDLRVSQSQFNSYRSLNLTDAVPALQFELIDPKQLENLASKRKVALFEQVRVLQSESERSRARSDAEAAAPKLDLKGDLIVQGRDNTVGSSYSDMNDHRRNLWSVGIAFQTPLDISLTRDLRRAANYSERAAIERLQRSPVDRELSWISEREDLLRCAQSLSLVRDLEDSQRKRVQSEESKYRNGRSTVFLVLSAEQDLINAESQKWSSELQCRIIMAQTRLFNEEG